MIEQHIYNHKTTCNHMHFYIDGRKCVQSLLCSVWLIISAVLLLYHNPKKMTRFGTMWEKSMCPSLIYGGVGKFYMTEFNIWGQVFVEISEYEQYT